MANCHILYVFLLFICRQMYGEESTLIKQSQMQESLDFRVMRGTRRIR